MNSNILLIDKPKYITSNDICTKLKRKYKWIKKIGHAGTLDPMATGLMVLGINKGTKELTTLIEDDKQYIASIKFGIQTTTFDAEGDVTNSSNKKVSLSEIQNIIDKFNNTYFYQQPPIFSAIKINGKKLYEYGRSKIDIEIPWRKVSINNIQILNFDYETQILNIIIDVKKGFYVRSFANDIGIILGTYAFLNDLRRTKSGKFIIQDAYNFQDILDDEITLISTQNQ